MNLKEMHEYFDVLIDKWGGEYFEPSEKDVFLTDALEQFIIESIEQRAGVRIGSGATPKVLSSIESTIRGLEQIRPYLFTVFEALDDSGIIRFDRIDSLVQSYYLSNDFEASTDVDYRMKFMLALGRLGLTSHKEDATEVHFVRHNDLYRFNRNDFKKPSVDYPIFLIESQGIEILPYNPGGTYFITGIRATEMLYYDEDNYGLSGDRSVEPSIDEVYRKAITRKAAALAMASVGNSEKAMLIKNEEDY